MKMINRYFFAIALLGGSLPFVSCNDDEEVVNEWNMTYVSIQQEDYLKPIPSFNLQHIVDEKIEGEVSIPVVAVIQKASNHDIKVNINVACEGISSEKIEQTADCAIIKAGDTRSSPVVVGIKDWSDIESTPKAAVYFLNIKMGQIETDASDVVSSNFYQSVSVKISKREATPENLIFGEEPSGSELHSDVSSWNFQFMSGVENAGSNSVAGTGSSDVATNGIPFWIVVDFKATKKITGIKTQHWGGYFAPSKIEIYVSDNGSIWKPMGEVSTNGSTQIIAFKKPVITQYLKYQMVDVPSRVDVTRFNVYMKK